MKNETEELTALYIVLYSFFKEHDYYYDDAAICIFCYMVFFDLSRKMEGKESIPMYLSPSYFKTCGITQYHFYHAIQYLQRKGFIISHERYTVYPYTKKYSINWDMIYSQQNRFPTLSFNQEQY